MEIIKQIGIVLAVVAVVVAVWALAIWLFMILWNWVMPYLFKLPEITYWMSAAILILLAIIRGSIIRVND